jgi:hypothetical protein
MDDEGWRSALVIPLPYEVSPGENGAAPVVTECRLTYDDESLYLGCIAQDPDPDAIRAYVVDRDGIDGHDRIVLTLDPFNDQRRAFQFSVSALGVQSDAVLSQQGTAMQLGGPLPPDQSWDAIWRSAGAINPDGFVVEAEIPFRSLRFPGSRGPATWGVYLSRWWPRSSNVEIRSATWDRGNSCVLCQANLVSGFGGVAPGANVQLAPTLTAARTDTRRDFPEGPMTAGPTARDVGLDAQWGITSDLTVNLTANPDFSQVEADVAQLDVNNRFALFFPEKRPFFLEGADFFGTPLRAVFTRSISDPSVGGKLTGKLGSNAVGFLMARDGVNNLLIPGSQFSSSTSLEQEVTTTVARFRRDLGGASTVGGLFTGREAAGYHNRVGGVDAFYRPHDAVTVQAQYLRSETAYPRSVRAEHEQPEGTFGGNAALAMLNLDTSDWTLNANLRQVDPGFRADAGFVTMAGVRGGMVAAGRRFFGDSGDWFTRIQATVGLWRNDDFDGNRLNGGMWFGVNYQGPGQTSIGVWPNLFMREHFGGRTYEGMRQLWFDVRSQPSGALAFGLNGNVGDAVDFANERRGTELRLAPVATLRVGRNVEVGIQHTYQRLDHEGRRVFAANLTQLRGVYNFSTRSFFRAIVQYRRTDRHAELYAQPVDRLSTAVFAQLLYAYKLNPQTVFFLGYGEDQSGSTDPRGERVPLTTQGRTLFLKLGYAWRP